MARSKSFLNDILTLSAVPLISQVIGFFLTPLVTRLYEPEAFGLLNTYSSIIGVVAIFSTLGYHNALILPKHEYSAFKILLVCIVSVIAITGISGLIFTFGNSFITNQLNSPEIKYYLWLVPVFVLLHGLYQTLRYWNVRLKSFSQIASSRVAETIGNKGFVLGAGYLGYATGGGLILGVLFASIIKNIILVRNVLKDISNQLKIRPNWSDILASAKRYRKFPLIGLWGELLSRIPALITVYLFLKYFNQTILGYYSLSLMVLTLPTTLITSSIMEAFSPRVAMAKHDGSHVVLLQKVYERIVSLTFFPFMILGIFGDLLFNFVFGVNWIEAGVIAQILVIRAFVEIIFTPVLSLINIMEKQEIDLISKGINIVTVIVSLTVGGIYQNFYLAILLLALLDGLVMAAAGLYMMYLIKFPILQMIKKLLFYMYACIIIGAILIVVRIEMDLSIIIILSVICFATAVYYLSVLYYDNTLRSIIFSYVKRITSARK